MSTVTSTKLVYLIHSLIILNSLIGSKFTSCFSDVRMTPVAYTVIYSYLSNSNENAAPRGAVVAFLQFWQRRQMSWLLYLLTFLLTYLLYCFRSPRWSRAEAYISRIARWIIYSSSSSSINSVASRIIQSYVLRAWLNMASRPHNAACVRDLLSLAVRKEFCCSSRPPARSGPPAVCYMLLATPSGTV